MALGFAARAADATSPVDAAQRNGPFAPAASVTAPKKDSPKTNETVQEKRFEKPTVEKQTAPLAERRAAIDIQETREKSIREKDSHRPETKEQPKSAFSHREAAISTQGDATKPPMVAKYQDSLAAPTAWGPAAAAGNTARFSTTDKGTVAKINRFVFRKNPAETSAALDGTPVTPAAGGGAIKK